MISPSDGRLRRSILAASLEPPSSSQDFSFVANDGLKQIIRRDYAELHKVRDAQAPKSRIVLAGGLIEAILLDVLLQNKQKAQSAKAAQSDPELEKWDLAHLLKVAVELKLLTPDAHRYGEFARAYRNLVHPGLELRSTQTVRAEVANIAEQVLEMAIADIRKSMPTPIISSVLASEITPSGARIEWKTDKASTSQVLYGTTLEYGQATGLSASFVTDHAVLLNGLAPSTRYHFQAVSKGEQGWKALSDDATFTTEPREVKK